MIINLALLFLISYAVLVFFLLSGYFALHSLENNSKKEYAIRRLTKLYPTYWMAIFITMPLTILFLPERAVTFEDMIVNLTMLQTIFGKSNVDGAYWTLFCELTFYVLIFFIILFKWNDKTKVVRIVYIWTIMQLVLFFVPDILPIMMVKKINALSYMHCFMVGLVIAIIEKNIRDKQKKYSQNICLGICLLFFVSEQFIQHESSSGIFFIFAIAVVVLAIVAHNKVNLPTKIKKILSPLTFVAKISYPLYLLHQNIGYIIIRYLEKAGIFNELLLLIIPFSAVICLASLMYYYIEKPMEFFCNKLINKVLSSENRRR